MSNSRCQAPDSGFRRTQQRSPSAGRAKHPGHRRRSPVGPDREPPERTRQRSLPALSSESEIQRRPSVPIDMHRTTMYKASTYELSKDLVAASATPLVLAILAEGESYGYAILKRVAELSGGHLQWTDGMLYPRAAPPRAARLCRGELVPRPRPAGRRKYYRLTDARPGRSSRTQRQQWKAVDDALRGVWMKSVPRYDGMPPRPTRSRSKSRSGGRTCAAARCIHGPDVEELEGPPARPVGGAHRGRPALATKRSLSRSSAWAASTRCRASSRARTPSGCGSSSCLRRRRWMATSSAHPPRRCVVLALAIAAALAVKVPSLFGIPLSPDDGPAGVLHSQRQPVRLPAARCLFRLEARRRACISGVWLALPFAAASPVRQRLPASARPATRRC